MPHKLAAYQVTKRLTPISDTLDTLIRQVTKLMADVHTGSLQPDLQQQTMVEVGLLRISLADEIGKSVRLAQELYEIRDAMGQEFDLTHSELIEIVNYQREKESSGQ